MSSTRYPEFTVSGSPREMGNQIGEQAGDLVSRFCEVALESANRMATASPEFAREVSAKSLEFAREYSPDLVDELEGIAEASNVDILDLTLAQVRNQFTDDNDNACTSFSASPSFVSDGHHIVAQIFFPFFRTWLTIIKSNSMSHYLIYFGSSFNFFFKIF